MQAPTSAMVASRSRQQYVSLEDSQVGIVWPVKKLVYIVFFLFFSYRNVKTIWWLLSYCGTHCDDDRINEIWILGRNDTSPSRTRRDSNQSTSTVLSAQAAEEPVLASSIETTRSDLTRKPTTAVVITTAFLTPCKAIRLEHLLQSVLPGSLDVWLLHNHVSIETNHPDLLQESVGLLHKLQQQYPLFDINQKGEFIPTFDTSRSGAAKSSFLRWLVAHPEYHAAWHLEDDLWFTGQWSAFFEEYKNHHADFVVKRNFPKSKWNKYSSCHLDKHYLPSSNSSSVSNSIPQNNKTRVPCIKVVSWSVLWPIIRISTRAAQLLLNDMQSGLLVGHHEVVLQAFMLAHHELNVSVIAKHLGKIEAGGWGRFSYSERLKLSIHSPILPDSVYHPVKCEAYAKYAKSRDAMREMLSSAGWKEGIIDSWSNSTNSNTGHNSSV